MRTEHIPVDDLGQAEVLEDPDSPPEGGLRAAGQLGDLSLFRVDVAIVGPKPEQPQRYLSLCYRKSQGAGQELPYQVIVLTEELRR